LAIPTTLHASLMARLDRLAPVREVAQIGAVAGREFHYELLYAVAGMPRERLEDALGQLSLRRAAAGRLSPARSCFRRRSDRGDRASRCRRWEDQSTAVQTPVGT
jgi:hypothetical protein